MAGIFGDNTIDRIMEQQLNEHLKDDDDYNSFCERVISFMPSEEELTQEAFSELDEFLESVECEQILDWLHSRGFSEKEIASKLMDYFKYGFFEL